MVSVAGFQNDIDINTFVSHVEYIFYPSQCSRITAKTQFSSWFCGVMIHCLLSLINLCLLWSNYFLCKNLCTMYYHQKEPHQTSV